MTTDIIDGTKDNWFDIYLDEWKDAGWETDGIADYLHSNNDNATEAINHVEYLIDSSEHLIARMSHEWLARLDLSDGLFADWIEALNNPLNYQAIAERYLEWAKQHRRWELVLDDSRDIWMAAMLEEQRLLILARCDALDESSKPQLNLLISLMSDPQSLVSLEAKLSDIEAGEARQKRAIYSSVVALESEGYDVGYISEMNLIEGMQEVGQKQKLHSFHEMIRLQIIDEISEFDDTLAEQYETRRKELLNSADESDITELSNDISAMGLELKKRLSAVKLKIAEWEDSGIILQSGNITAKDLFEWETNLPELAKEIDSHLALVERYEFLSERMGGVATAAEFIGYLDQTGALTEIVEDLELRWKDAELECYSIIEKYQTLGLELDGWNEQISTHPITSLAQIKTNEVIWQDRIECIEELLKLDISFRGNDEVEKRINLLREIDAEADVIDDTRLMIDRIVRRNTRHRILLEKELMELIAEGKASDDTLSHNMNLQEFENFVGDARRYGTENQSALLSNVTISDNIAERIKTKLAEEITLFESAGWYIDELQAMLVESPLHVAKLLPSVRKNVMNYQTTVRRLVSMPWNRDVERAIKIQEAMQNPLNLAQINEQIPHLMKAIASLPIEDEEFSFTPWMPDSSVIIPDPDNNVIQPADALGDAHEAILESMEHDVEGLPPPEVSQIVSTKDAIMPDNEVIENHDPINEQTPVIEDIEISKPIQLTAKTITTNDSADIEHLHTMMNKLGLSENYDSTAQSSVQIQDIRRSLAKEVGIEPRDVRVDRMLRLLLRLLPQSNEHDSRRKELIMDIVNGLKRYEDWIKMRLEARHKASKNSLILDSEILGKALDRIPGPGFKVPLQKDEKELPALDSIEELADEVEALINVLNLESASGVVVAA